MYTRTIFKKLEQSLDLYPVIIVTGPRQVGKSTEVYRLVASHGFRYVTLDDIEKRAEALTDPVFFLQRYGYPLIIDEIQYAPILMEVIESIVNKKRLEEGNANGMFVLTGSQSFSLMRGVTQSLAGRATLFSMNPLSRNELIGKEEIPFLPDMQKLKTQEAPVNINELYKMIVRGFYPELLSNPQIPTRQFYSDYVRTYLDTDINELINLKDKLKFHNFLQYLASTTSQQINYTHLAQDVGVDIKTVKGWISILETSGIIFLLQPYSEYKLSKRIVKSPKLYFCDTGLAAYLARVYDSENLLISNLAGAFMETYVINEIRKSYENNGLELPGYYYRDNNQNEVDLIIVENLNIHCIEIKKGSMFNNSHIRSFDKLKSSQYEMGTSCIICNTEEGYSINRDVCVLPVTSI